MFNAAKAKGVAVFFIIGRRNKERQATLWNLDRAGFDGWAKLVTGADDPHPTIQAFKTKTEERVKIAAAGYTIVATVGDQQSDLDGSFAECAFKVPNPFYSLRRSSRTPLMAAFRRVDGRLAVAIVPGLKRRQSQPKIFSICISKDLFRQFVCPELFRPKVEAPCAASPSPLWLRSCWQSALPLCSMQIRRPRRRNSRLEPFVCNSIVNECAPGFVGVAG
jgi:hypothetical protein